MLKFIKYRRKTTSKRKIKKSPNGVLWTKAPDVEKKVKNILKKLDSTLDIENIYFYRSTFSKSRAYARIWGLSRLWQMALGVKPSYIIEVLSQHFDKLSEHEKDKVLLHELAHIPKNFSGSLLPHTRKRGKRNFNDRVKTLIGKFQS